MENYQDVIIAKVEDGTLDINTSHQAVKKNYSIRFEDLESSMKYRIELEELLVDILCKQLFALKIFDTANLTLQDVQESNELGSGYWQWFVETLSILNERNKIKFDGKTISIQQTLNKDSGELWDNWNKKKGEWKNDKNIMAQVPLLEKTLENLTKIITGKVPATDIIFPDSSMQLVEGVYKNNQLSDYYNDLLAQKIAVYISEKIKNDSSAQVNIIEIGAGTGGTSEMVFEYVRKYSDYIGEYCYTDISQAFLMHARQKFGPYNTFLTYKIFDVESPIEGQGVKPGQYDIVIATNVLHATRNISNTIRNAKACLKNNGILIINELSDKSIFTHLTFGLL
jgi:polyketide synthase PksM